MMPRAAFRVFGVRGSRALTPDAAPRGRREPAPPLPSAGVSSRRAACLSQVLPATMSSGLVPGRLAAQRYRAI